VCNVAVANCLNELAIARDVRPVRTEGLAECAAEKDSLRLHSEVIHGATAIGTEHAHRVGVVQPDITSVGSVTSR